MWDPSSIYTLIAGPLFPEKRLQFVLGALINMLPIFLCLLILFTLILVTVVGFLYKVWWTPIYIKYVMSSQGIKGPPYKFLHGSTQEMTNLKNQSTSHPVALSHDIFPITQPHVYAWIKLYGTNFVMWEGHQPQLVITEPELVKEILSNKDGAYQKIKLDGPVKRLLGDGLVVSEAEKWSKLRKLANHAFHGDSLKEMLPEMTSSVETMLERWRHQEGKEIEVFEEFRLLTSEVISKTAFGSSYLEGKNIFEMLEKLIVLIFKNNFKVRFPIVEKLYKSSDDIEADKIDVSLRNSIIEIITKREEKVKTGETESFGSDFLGSLLQFHHDADEKHKILLDDVIDECKTFYIAGHETTNTTLAWTILLLAIHTDWQQKARNEVLELFGQETPNPEGIAKLKTLNMILYETLRLYSPVTLIVRRVKSTTKLGTLIIPPNIDLFIPPLALHQSNEIWGQDAHLFKPDRFSAGVSQAMKNMIGFLPFGFGPRTCVGMNFAYMEAKIALSMILQRYKFTLSPSYVHSPTPLLTLRPQRGVQVMLHQI